MGNRRDSKNPNPGSFQSHLDPSVSLFDLKFLRVLDLRVVSPESSVSSSPRRAGPVSRRPDVDPTTAVPATTRVYLCVRVFVCVSLCVRMHTWVCVLVCVSPCTYVYVCVCV